MENAGVRVHQRGIAAAVSVHPGVGVVRAGGRDAGLRRLGADFNLQEVINMRVRMVCIHLPKVLGGVVKWMSGRRRK